MGLKCSFSYFAYIFLVFVSLNKIISCFWTILNFMLFLRNYFRLILCRNRNVQAVIKKKSATVESSVHSAAPHTSPLSTIVKPYHQHQPSSPLSAIFKPSWQHQPFPPLFRNVRAVIVIPALLPPFPQYLSRHGSPSPPPFPQH